MFKKMSASTLSLYLFCLRRKLTKRIFDHGVKKVSNLLVGGLIVSLTAQHLSQNHRIWKSRVSQNLLLTISIYIYVRHIQ